MRDIAYLTKRDGVYYVRLDVPEDLVQILKTTTRKKSLKTKDKTEAKSRMWPVITEWQREFEDLRSRRTLVDADRQHAVWDHYTAVLERDEAQRASLPTQAEIDAIKSELYARAERGEIKGIDPLSILDATLELTVAQNAAKLSTDARRIKLAEMKRHLAQGETALIAHEVDDYIQRNSLLVERSTRWLFESSTRRLRN